LGGDKKYLLFNIQLGGIRRTSIKKKKKKKKNHAVSKAREGRRVSLVVTVASVHDDYIFG